MSHHVVCCAVSKRKDTHPHAFIRGILTQGRLSLTRDHSDKIFKSLRHFTIWRGFRCQEMKGYWAFRRTPGAWADYFKCIFYLYFSKWIEFYSKHDFFKNFGAAFISSSLLLLFYPWAYVTVITLTRLTFLKMSQLATQMTHLFAITL